MSNDENTLFAGSSPAMRTIIPQEIEVPGVLSVAGIPNRIFRNPVEADCLTTYSSRSIPQQPSGSKSVAGSICPFAPHRFKQTMRMLMSAGETPDMRAA